jgi:hypothetical protein
MTHRASRSIGRWLIGSAVAAAIGCNGSGSGAANGGGAPQDALDASSPDSAKNATNTTVPPGSDPMQIAQQPLPSTPKSDVANLDVSLFPKQGDTTFETAKDVDPNASNGQGVPSVGVANASDSRAAAPPMTATPTGAASAPAGAPAAPGTAPTLGPAAPATPTSGAAAMREIVEADVVQAQGDMLYVLNRYRGLLVIDMSVADSPLIVGRVPFQAQPVDMYLRDGKAYIVMSDYFSYWQFDKDTDPQGFHGSQLLVVDVSNPAKPQESGSFKLDGEVTDTRIVGDVLYSVSKRNPDYWRYDTQDWHDTTWVVSIDIKDPAHIAQVDKKEFPGAANLIQVYETALSIAAIDPNYYLVDNTNPRQTLITYVDISDPQGSIHVGGNAYVPGTVEDKFKMDLSAGQLRVISEDYYWQPNSAAALTVFDASDPTKLLQRAQISVANDAGNSGTVAQPQATRFVGPDLFVSLCWWEQNAQVQSCRMDLYDLATPSSPAKVAGMAVDGPITYFEAQGNRLLALGSHPQAGQQGNVQIALYDISTLKTTRVLSSVDLGTSMGSSSAALGDYKAFKVFSDLNMILLPLSWSDSPTMSYVGAQIVDWQNDQLTQRGRIAQGGDVQRAIAFKDRIVSISTQQIQVIDASDRDKPVQTANLFLVRNIVDVFSIHGYQVQLGADEEDSSYRFFVLPFGEDDMAKSLVELPVDSSLFYQMQAGDMVHVIGNDPSNGDQLIRTADFSDPLHPRWRGEYRLPAEIQHLYNGGYGGYWSFYDYFWNPGVGQPLEHQLLPATVRTVEMGSDGRRYYKNYLRVIDLRDADKPRLADGSVEMKDWPFVNQVTHGSMLYSTHTEPALDMNGNPKQYHERYFLDRVDATDPDHLKALPKVNIPGRLVDVDASGQLLYTVDYQFDEYGRRRNSLDVLTLAADTATLATVLPVGDDIDRARYLDREVWLTTQAYPWWGLTDDSADSRQPYTRLTRLRFNDKAEIASNDQHDVAGYHFDLLDVDGTRVYLASSYPTGLLILDTSNFASPVIEGAARTVGYVSKIVRDADYLYLPMGSYGVRRIQAP